MTANASDLVLLKAWQRNRDAEAFHILVNRHARLVYNTCRHIVRNDTDAADVAQECFLNLATSPPQLERSLAGWLHRLATHRSLNHLKRQKRRRDREVRYARELPDLLHPETDDLLSLIDEAIDSLPDELRIPLVDHFLSRRSHHEVAIELGVPRRTVSYRINSGIEQVRNSLSKRGVSAPMAGLIALLEWQRADAEALPETLRTTLSKYAIAGATAAGARGLRRAALVASGMSGTVLLTLLATLVLGLVLWLVPRGSISAAPEDTPVVTDEVEEPNQSEGLASVEPNTANETELVRAAAGVAQVDGIAGKVTGRVFDADTDAPIAGAEVKIAKDSDTHSPVATCTTDAEGIFESESLPAGAYMIYRGKTPGYGATSLRINAAGKWLSNPEMDGLRFQLARDIAIDLPVRKGLVVNGIVVDALGNGIANATVTARARYQNNGQTTQTAHDGTFFLAGFSSSYNLCMSVTKSGYGRRNFSRLDIGFPGLESLRIELSPEARISGQLIHDDGTPIADARILAIHDADALRWPLGFSGADTNADGKFNIDGLGPGRYGVQVFSGDQKIRGIDPNAVFVNLDAGQSVENVNLRIPTPEGITVSGIVTDPNGEPIANQVISLGVPTRTDAAGRFVIAGLPGGQYQFKAEVDGYRTGFERVIRDTTMDPETAMQKRGFLTIDRDRDDLHLVLYPNSFTLTGRVVNAASGEPMKYFELDTLPQGAYPGSTETWQAARRVFSEDGSFRLNNVAVGPGSWSVVAWVPGFGVGFADLTVLPDSTEAEVTVEITEGIAVSGAVVDQNNEPVEGAEIIFGQAFESRVAVTASDGSFHASGLPANIQLKGSPQRVGSDPAGPTLTAFHTDFAPITIPLPQTGDKTPIIFKFAPSGTIDVKISRDGKPITMASVMASRAIDLVPRCIGVPDKSVSDDGTARFTGVPVGQQRLYIQALSNSVASLELERFVEVVAGEVTPVHIELSGELASLHGTVLMDGMPAVNAQVSFTSASETDPISVSANRISADGAWSMDEVPAGAGTLKIGTYADEVLLERSFPIEIAPGVAATVHVNHGGIGDEAEETGILRGNIRIEGTWPEHASISYEIDKSDTHFLYRSFQSIRRTQVLPDGTPAPEGPPPVADEALEWSLESVAAGTGVLKVEANEPDGGSYVRFIELNLTADEEQELEIILTDDDLEVEEEQP